MKPSCDDITRVAKEHARDLYGRQPWNAAQGVKKLIAASRRVCEKTSLRNIVASLFVRDMTTIY